MPHLPFIIAAYAITILGIGGMVLTAVRRMRRAERALDGDM